METNNLKVDDNLNALMLKTYGLGHLFKGYLEAVDVSLRESYTKFFDKKLETATNPEHIKYLKKQKKYQVNKVRKDNEGLFNELEKTLKPYRDASESSKEAIDSFMDFANEFIDAMVVVKDDVVRIREFRISENDSVSSDS